MQGAGKQADRVRGCLPAYQVCGLRAGCRSYFSPERGLGEVVAPGRGWVVAGWVFGWAGDSNQPCGRGVVVLLFGGCCLFVAAAVALSVLASICEVYLGVHHGVEMLF